MKTLFSIALLTLVFTLAARADWWMVTANANNTFTPPNITIQQGDTVRWTNISGTHNVRESGATPLFRSGDPASGFWVYEFDFHGVTPTTYDYICENHAPGMSGTVTVEASSGVCDDLCRPATVENFGVLSSYPNPFNPATMISFSVERAGHIRLAVYDRLGREVAVLADRAFDAGDFEVPFVGTALPSGVYFARMESRSKITTTKLLLLK